MNDLLKLAAFCCMVYVIVKVGMAILWPN